MPDILEIFLHFGGIYGCGVSRRIFLVLFPGINIIILRGINDSTCKYAKYPV